MEGIMRTFGCSKRSGKQKEEKGDSYITHHADLKVDGNHAGSGIGECQRSSQEAERTAREVDFCPGDKDLVLLPMSTSKFLAQWNGPYEIIRKMVKSTMKCECKEELRRYSL
jgi:hypothetical protein